MIYYKRYVISSLAIILLFAACKKANDAPPQLAGVRVTSSGVNMAVVLNTMITNGGSAPSVVGTCWSSTERLPTLEKNGGMTINHPGVNGVYTDTLKGLSYNTKYYIRAYGTNPIGTGYSEVDSFFTLQTEYPPGKAAFGGAVLYVDSTGEHGLVVALPQYITTLPWSNSYEQVSGTLTDFGTGPANTQSILSSLADPTGSAANYCRNLTAEGYHDWFLPSYDEMNYFRDNITFAQWLSYPWNSYWSSSEYSQGSAYFVVIGGGADFHDYDKAVALSVLPMRNF